MLQAHIKLKTVDHICLISGNPDRVENIASFLENSQKVAEHRGLIAYKGVTPINKIPVTVLTSGMGTGSSSIVFEEAYNAGARVIIRIGSTGALQNDPIGSIFIPHAAIRDEGTTIHRIPLQFPAVADPILHQKLIQSASELNIKILPGIVWTTDIYYYPDENHHKKWSQFGANCVEMESSALFIFAAYKQDGIMAATILTSDGSLNDNIENIYKGNVEDNTKIFQDSVINSIKIVINAIEKL